MIYSPNQINSESTECYTNHEISDKVKHLLECIKVFDFTWSRHVFFFVVLLQPGMGSLPMHSRGLVSETKPFSPKYTCTDLIKWTRDTSLNNRLLRLQWNWLSQS